MNRHLTILILMLTLLPAGFVAGQDDPVAEEQDSPAQADAAPDEDETPPVDPELDAELESENYADAEEKDFVPTEDIPTDQAIPFPSDI